MAEKSSKLCVKSSFEKNSVISSVDTATYILSNMNTRNKVKAIAITKKQKCKNVTITSLDNLNSVVCLKRLSAFDMQKEKKPKMTVTSHENFSPVTDNVNMLHKNIILLSQHNKSKNSFCEMRTINLSEDSDNSSSSFLMYECESNVFWDEVSVSSNNRHQLDITTKEILNKTDENLNTNILHVWSEMTKDNVMVSRPNTVHKHNVSGTCKTLQKKTFNNRQICKSILLKDLVQNNFGNYKVNSKHADKYDIINTNFRTIYNNNNNIEPNLRMDKDLLLQKDYKQNIYCTSNIPVSSRAHINGISHTDECQNNYNNNDKELLSSDEEDEFVKLVLKYYPTWK